METKELTVLATIDDRVLAVQQLETAFELAVRQRELLEKYIRERLKPDRHYYRVGDDTTRKPSLAKEGAEIICLAHALKAHYSFEAGPHTPPADGTPYQIITKCELETNGKFAGGGIGSASSYLTTKSGEYKPRQNDPGLCHNATLKMAQKSAYIAATLNATAASEFFTQDMEDDQMGGIAEADTRQHWCSVHQTPFFKKGKMKNYAHPIKDAEGRDTGVWCQEHKEQAPAPEAPPAASEELTGGGKLSGLITLEDFKLVLDELHLTTDDLPKKEYLGCTLRDWVKGNRTVPEAIEQLRYAVGHQESSQPKLSAQEE